jgi:hypothetical protein
MFAKRKEVTQEDSIRAWHVRIEPPYAHGRGLVVYLARYLRGGPIKNHRLLACAGGRVRFTAKEPHRGRAIA